MASGEDSALGRRSAGQHWGISRHYAPLIDVVVPRQRRAQDGIKLLASRGLLHGDVTVHDGIPVTTVARTLVDLADVLTPHQLTRVIREAEFRGLFDAADTSAGDGPGTRASRSALRRPRGRDRGGLLVARAGPRRRDRRREPPAEAGAARRRLAARSGLHGPRFTDFEVEHRPDTVVATLAGWLIDHR